MSDRSGIEVFEPRQAANTDSRDLVWAVDAGHLVNYLVPRECPRVCYRPGPRTSPEDRQRFFPGGACAVVAIEAAWFTRAAAQPLWLYTLPPSGFVMEDENAGYFVSPRAVAPATCRVVERPIEERLSRGAELRVLARLHQLAETVVRSTLSFSLIRMRNALP